MVDTTPAAVREKDRFVPSVAEADTPLKKGSKSQGEEEDMLTAPVAQAEGKELPADHEEAEADETMDSDDALRAFAREVADTDDEDEDDEEDSSDEEDDEEEEEALPQALYDNEADLQKAIEGRIVDDSSAPVCCAPLSLPRAPCSHPEAGHGPLLQRGRPHKDLRPLRRCAFSPPAFLSSEQYTSRADAKHAHTEHGHSSRDCTHSQCFVCGAIDADHEARNCPVALVCSACGSRGHYARVRPPPVPSSSPETRQCGLD